MDINMDAVAYIILTQLDNIQYDEQSKEANREEENNLYK